MRRLLFATLALAAVVLTARPAAAQALVKEYPGTPREPEALMGLAQAYLKMNERFRAQQALQQLIVRYPKDPRRAEAEKLLASLR